MIALNVHQGRLFPTPTMAFAANVLQGPLKRAELPVKLAQKELCLLWEQ